MKPAAKRESGTVLANHFGVRSTLGRTRTCDLLIRSQTRSRTRGDRERHGETKPRFYQGSTGLEGTGRDRERHGVVVPLWYERATDCLARMNCSRSYGA